MTAPQEKVWRAFAKRRRKEVWLMTKMAIKQKTAPASLPKSATGIQGLDEVSGGGLPLGRPTLVCGSAGCGKTLLAMEFLVRGAMQYGEPGVFVAFEETAE